MNLQFDPADSLFLIKNKHEYKTILIIFAILFVRNSIAAQNSISPSGRIAIVADGNSPDPDDLGGTAVSLALLRAAGLEHRLVHYSHCCDLLVVQRISKAAEHERHAMMQTACDGTVHRWKGFEQITFFDANSNLHFHVPHG